MECINCNITFDLAFPLIMIILLFFEGFLHLDQDLIDKILFFVVKKIKVSRERNGCGTFLDVTSKIKCCNYRTKERWLTFSDQMFLLFI